MIDALPELRVGDVLIKRTSGGDSCEFRVRRIGRGKEFDEPVYFLSGMYGVKLNKSYTGEEIAGMGYTLKEKAATAKETQDCVGRAVFPSED